MFKDLVSYVKVKVLLFSSDTHTGSLLPSRKSHSRKCRLCPIDASQHESLGHFSNKGKP